MQQGEFAPRLLDAVDVLLIDEQATSLVADGNAPTAGIDVMQRFAIQEIDAHALTGHLDWRDSARTGLPTLQLHHQASTSVLEFSSLGELLALLERTDVLIASETPSISLASGLRTPTVAVWRTPHPAYVVPAVPHIEHLLFPECRALPLPRRRTTTAR